MSLAEYPLACAVSIQVLVRPADIIGDVAMIDHR